MSEIMKWKQDMVAFTNDEEKHRMTYNRKEVRYDDTGRVITGNTYGS